MNVFTKIVDCDDLDTTNVEIFVDGLMKKFGSSRVVNQEEKVTNIKRKYTRRPW